MAADIYKQYRESEVLQADPVKLVELMYDGAVRFARQAKKAIEDGNVEAAHNHILRCYAVVAELMATLDFDQGEEIAKQLEQVYDYVLHLLKEANIQKDAALLQQAVEILEPLGESWRNAFNKKPQAAEASKNGKQEGGEKDKEDKKHKPLDLMG
jgi:flagellar protein FliS